MGQLEEVIMIRHIVVFLAIFSLAYSGCPFEAAAKNARFIKSGDDSPDPETTTPNGCICNSLCGATIDDAFTLDWCTVDGDCGNYDLIFGYWDHCLYKDSSKPDYVSLDWKTKHDMIWNKVRANDSFGAFYRADIVFESVVTTFEAEWDVLPAGRKKTLHGIGAICPWTIEVSPDSPFTGVFKAGAKVHGFIRMGSGIDIMGPDAKGRLPGAAIKILRTGTTSANWVLFNTLGPLPNGNHNQFAVPLHNHVPPPGDIPVIIAAQKFCQTGHCITKVGLSHVGTHDQDGNEFPDPIFPFKFTFAPTGEVEHSEAKPDSMEQFMDQYRAIPVGTRLYTVSGHQGPEGPEALLGDLITTDNCVSSHWADTRMFFKHQWIEDDVAYRPDWT